MAVFYDVALRSVDDVDRCFIGSYCLHHQAGPFSMMEAANSPETSVDVLQSIQCNSPDESHPILLTFRTSELIKRLNFTCLSEGSSFRSQRHPS
jgi:hypothetical protein